MRYHHHPLTLLLVALMASLAACAPATTPGVQFTGGDEARRVTGLKRITGAIVSGDPFVLRSNAGGAFGGGATAGLDSLEDLLHAGATRRDDTDSLRPLLAEALPSTENGLWKVLPDGRMETTWTLRSGGRWHDGTLVTSQDLLFTLTVCRDDEMVAFCDHVGFGFIETARLSDDRTIIVGWKQPYIEADALFTTQFGMPMPSHLLEIAYRETKLGITELPYWQREFIGTGPFQLRDWVDNSHLVLTAFDGYVLGRPTIDEVVVKFIPDPNAVVANVLAGEIDLTLGRGISLTQALEIRDQWRDGRLEVGRPGNWIIAYPQFIDPRPAALLDVRFRRALVHAIDRQEMVEALQGGLVPVAHAYFDTTLPIYRELDPLVVKYDFDPRRAGQLIEATGYSRDSGGSFRNPAGQQLSLEIRVTGSQEVTTRAMFSIGDYWQRVGIEAETLVISRQRVRDREYRATRPGFEMSQLPDGMKGLRRAHGSQTPLPENNYGRTGNTARYLNADFDALLDRFLSTIPTRERTRILGQILHHTSDQVTLIPVFYGAYPTLVSNRLIGHGPRMAQEGTDAWNAHEWDVR